MRDNHPKPVENYTDAFLATLGAILFVGFLVLAAVAGFLWVVMIAYGMDKGISWLGRFRS